MKEIILLKMTKKWQKDLFHIIQNFRTAKIITPFLFFILSIHFKKVG